MKLNYLVSLASMALVIGQALAHPNPPPEELNLKQEHKQFRDRALSDLRKLAAMKYETLGEAIKLRESNQVVSYQQPQHGQVGEDHPRYKYINGVVELQHSIMPVSANYQLAKAHSSFVNYNEGSRKMRKEAKKLQKWYDLAIDWTLRHAEDASGDLKSVKDLKKERKVIENEMKKMKM